MGVATGVLCDSPISFFTKQQRERRWQMNLAQQHMEAAHTRVSMGNTSVAHGGPAGRAEY
jgi:hypothetical protein